MPNITVKNIPDDLYRRLKAVAKRNQRSLNGEIINRIERSLSPQRIPTNQLVAKLRDLHESLDHDALSLAQIEEARRQDRP